MFTAVNNVTGVQYTWSNSTFQFDKVNHSSTVTGGGIPGLTLGSSLVGTSTPSTVAGIVVDSQPATGHDVVYFPTASAVETFDVLTSPTAPGVLRWSVSSDGLPLSVDPETGVASSSDGTDVANFNGVAAADAQGQPVDVTTSGGLGYLQVTLPGGLSASQYPIVIDPTWNRTTKAYVENHFSSLFGFGRHNYRVRGYNFQACIQFGVDCRTAAGAYKPEATAQAKAIRQLAVNHSLFGTFATFLPDQLDWEVGKRDDRTDEPPCNGTAGFRIDIVLNVAGFTDFGGKYRIVEAKNVNDASTVQGQLGCYLTKLHADKLDAGLLSELYNNRFATFWIEQDNGLKWYAWAPSPGVVLFASENQMSMIPSWVTSGAERAARERVSLPVGSPSPLPIPVPVPVPIPV